MNVYNQEIRRRDKNNWKPQTQSFHIQQKQDQSKNMKQIKLNCKIILQKNNHENKIYFVSENLQPIKNDNVSENQFNDENNSSDQLYESLIKQRINNVLTIQNKKAPINDEQQNYEQKVKNSIQFSNIKNLKQKENAQNQQKDSNIYSKSKGKKNIQQNHLTNNFKYPYQTSKKNIQKIQSINHLNRLDQTICINKSQSKPILQEYSSIQKKNKIKNINISSQNNQIDQSKIYFFNKVSLIPNIQKYLSSRDLQVIYKQCKRQNLHPCKWQLYIVNYIHKHKQKSHI